MWCRDAGLSKDACGAPERPYRHRAREHWCRYRGVDNCDAEFDRLDTKFEVDWQKERAAYLGNFEEFDLTNRDLRRAQLPGAFLAGVDFEGVRLEGANLANADLREVKNLRLARLEGADLSGAWLKSAEWAGATIGPSTAHSAHFTEGKSLTQSQLDLVIGDVATILPRDAETGEPLRVWSCWEAAAAARFIEIWTVPRAPLPSTPEEMWQDLIERDWICGPDNPRRPVGTSTEVLAPKGERTDCRFASIGIMHRRPTRTSMRRGGDRIPGQAAGR